MVVPFSIIEEMDGERVISAMTRAASLFQTAEAHQPQNTRMGSKVRGKRLKRIQQVQANVPISVDVLVHGHAESITNEHHCRWFERVLCIK